MQDQTQRLPAPRATLPDFAPVPRKCPRHDGWTPERQRAFVAALADTGCVAIAARMVNMSPESAYMLRRAPGAEGFRKAWEAAQGLGLQVVKDEAFHRAMHGQLVPVFVAGKLIGFRRKKNDRLLMFILRHYGQDAAGRRTTINYFSTRASAGTLPSPLVGSGPPFALSGGQGCGPDGDSRSERGEGAGGIAAPNLAAAEASTTTVKTVITGAPNQPDAPPGDDEAARLLETFAGVDLDEQAKADIYRALEQAAARRRALAASPAEDPEIWYVGTAEAGPYAGELEIGAELEEDVIHRPDGEHAWQSLGEGGNAAEIDRVVEEMRARLAAENPEARAAREAAIDAGVEAECKRRQAGGAPSTLNELDADDPRLDWHNWKSGQYVAPTSPLPLAEGDKEVGISAEEDCPSTGSGEHEPAETTSTKAGDKPRKPYKQRQPKPAFTRLDEATEARAREEVAAQRREAAEEERAERSSRRIGNEKGPCRKARLRVG